LRRKVADYPYTPPSAPYSHLIFKKVGLIHARNGKTGELEFSDKDAAKVIRSAINALNQGLIILKNLDEPPGLSHKDLIGSIDRSRVWNEGLRG